MVFRTIKENIMSFFQKEGELLQEPKKVPDAASEVMGDPKKDFTKYDAPQRIIENRADDLGVVKQSARLPYSAAQLKDALNKNTSAPQFSPQPTQPTHAMQTTQATQAMPSSSLEKIQSPPPNAQKEPVPAFDEDIRAFEDAIREVSGSSSHASSSTEYSADATKHISHAPATTPLKDGFFSSFEEFLETGSLDSSHLDGDLLHKMRNYHERRDEGKEPFVHQRDATEAVRRRLYELQVLEHEWHRRYHEARDLERSMIHLEEEIDERARSLRTLLGESTKVRLFAQEVPPAQAFVFANGERVCSLGALQRVLLRGDAALFSQHVTADRNDFASWIGSVLHMSELAGQIRSVRTRSEVLDLLRQS